MKVYVEYVILDNFVIDLLILYLVAITLKLRSGKWRVVFASSIGTVFALVLPLLALPNILIVLTKFCVAILMVSVLAQFKNIKQFLLALGLFVSYTFLLGGACLGALSLLSANITSFVSLNYSATVPVGLIIFMVWVYVRIIAEVAKYIYRRKEVSGFLFEVEVLTNNQNLMLSGFLDSGNHLFDEKLALPVVVVKARTFFKLFPELKNGEFCLDTTSTRLGRKMFNLYDAHYLNFSTVAGDNAKMLVAVPKEFYVKRGNQKVLKEVAIGLSESKLESVYDCLLPVAIG